jgi:hypothetical protein
MAYQAIYNSSYFRVQLVIHSFASAQEGQHGAERCGWRLDAETAVLSFLMAKRKEEDEQLSK